MGKLPCFLMFLSLVDQSISGLFPVALGQACFDTYQCTLVDSNSECDIGTTDTCICIAGYVEELTFCKIKIDGATPCEATDECPSNAACAGQCTCNRGYTAESFLCTGVVGMGCTSNCQCMDLLANTVCTSSQCTCVSGYTGLTCTDAVIGMVCSNDADCQNVLSNTVCTPFKCACAAGFSGSACSSTGAGKLLQTTTIPFATILLSVIYKYLS